MSNIDILNDDVILCVFNYLSSRDKIMFCSVNKYYRLLIDDIHFKSKYNDADIKYLSQYLVFKNQHEKFKNELVDIRDSIIFSPDNLRFKFLQIRWNLRCGLTYDINGNDNREIFKYFGINDVEKIQFIMLNDDIIFD
ncbi:hypothetical protein LBA_01117 [Megavirus lba]|uniref:F-box domain-containing protein n=1 Tax=Megavirus lba TaxID=1235314 RepID=L7Y009_9VIRU|nr:hypothetical protein LBA_01117 [Megavirus lba]